LEEVIEALRTQQRLRPSIERSDGEQSFGQWYRNRARPTSRDRDPTAEDPREREGESTMKFGYTILYVEDIEGAVSFYEEAFGLKRRFVHESEQYAEMETGQTMLAFASAELGESTLQAGFRRNDPAGLPAGIEIAFISRMSMLPSRPQRRPG
jgi:hypothetical protein